MDKLFDFTNITKIVGSSFERIKRHNKLLDETRKQYNPTFLEIMEELKNDDKTLFNMLMVWYMSKNSNTDITKNENINNIIDDFLKQQTELDIQRNDHINNGYITCGCGFDDEDDYVRSCMGAAC